MTTLDEEFAKASSGVIGVPWNAAPGASASSQAPAVSRAGAPLRLVTHRFMEQVSRIRG
jgi:hypothetical protein